MISHRFSVLTVLLVSTAFSCSSLTDKDLTGLWELEELKVDEYKRKHTPTFLEFHTNKSFAASMTSGDLAGIYRLNDEIIDFESIDSKWFNGRWTINYWGSHLFLKGKGVDQRNTKLKFKRIDVVPSFEEFENKMVGRWQLYKRQTDVVELVHDTWFNIDNKGNYTILKGETAVQKGKALIDTRHRQVFFQYDQTKWRAWFFGPELRLSNDEIGIKYRLRKANPQL